MIFLFLLFVCVRVHSVVNLDDFFFDVQDQLIDEPFIYELKQINTQLNHMTVIMKEKLEDISQKLELLQTEEF